MNLMIRQFREHMIQEINASQLPIEAKRLVLAEIMKQIEAVADNVIKQELAQAAEALKKEGESDEQSV